MDIFYEAMSDAFLWAFLNEPHCGDADDDFDMYCSGGYYV